MIPSKLKVMMENRLHGVVWFRHQSLYRFRGMVRFRFRSLKLTTSFLLIRNCCSVRTKIGEGAHGVVYEGKYGNQVVAVKVLNRGKTPEERVVLEGRFAREIAMMSRVKHDNLVKFIGACKDPYMVIITELFPGISVRKYLINTRPQQLDIHVAIGYALDIARAMECLHANGIIHRDLKPVIQHCHTAAG